jgi:hypothetical protein
MGEQDLFVSTEAEVEVDIETAAAIELGIADLSAGRIVSPEEIRARLPEWQKNTARLSRNSDPLGAGCKRRISSDRRLVVA